MSTAAGASVALRAKRVCSRIPCALFFNHNERSRVTCATPRPKKLTLVPWAVKVGHTRAATAETLCPSTIDQSLAKGGPTARGVAVRNDKFVAASEALPRRQGIKVTLGRGAAPLA